MHHCYRGPLIVHKSFWLQVATYQGFQMRYHLFLIWLYFMEFLPKSLGLIVSLSWYQGSPDFCKFWYFAIKSSKWKITLYVRRNLEILKIVLLYPIPYFLLHIPLGLIWWALVLYVYPHDPYVLEPCDFSAPETKFLWIVKQTVHCGANCHVFVYSNL